MFENVNKTQGAPAAHLQGDPEDSQLKLPLLL